MDVVERIRQVVSLAEIASQYTTLKKRGKKSVGLCPFHSEKDPSFTVDDDKQLFHCFGCGMGGDVFSLIMAKENLTFPEVVNQLARKYGIPLPAPTGASPGIIKLEEQIHEINESALAFFRKNLFNTAEGRTALDYLRKRDISEKTIQDMKIGYALPSWDALFSFFKKKNIPAGLLEKAGLVVPGRKKGEYYDRFRGRVIFPIFDLTGKAVAFGGRTIIDGNPKYLNSPDTPVYSKGRILFGLNLTKESIREKGEVILVEGYTDFTALYQTGMTNIAASLGTSLTQDQVSLARRFAPRIIVNYDGDRAGKAAAARAVSICFEKGLQTKVLVLPGDLDPDGFIHKSGPGEYRKLAEKSPSGLKFLIDCALEDVDLRIPEEKSRVIRQIVREIERIPDSVIRSEYLKQVSELLSCDEEIIRSLAARKPAAREERENAFLHAEKRLLQIIFTDKSLASSVFAEIGEEDFQGLKSAALFQTIHDYFQKKKEIHFHLLTQEIGASLSGSLSQVLLEECGPASLEEIKSCVDSLRKMTLENRLKKLQAEITRLEKRGEREKIPPLLCQTQELTRQILSL